MLYAAYQAHSDIMGPIRALAGIAAHSIGNFGIGMPGHGTVRNLTAAYELIARAGLAHSRPPFNINYVTAGNRDVEVREESARVTPFGTLLHFKKDIDAPQPRVLLVAPLSGHFSTLLRSTVRTMLPEHDVYITDWHNVRDVPLIHGRFGFDDYIAHLIRFLEAIGPGAHVVAVCQPCVAVLVATAVMAQAGNAAQPRSMTLMAGPIDTRVNPTKVNALANSKPIEWFERNLIATVPARYAGALRRVYPGFVQLAAFMSMNIERHGERVEPRAIKRTMLLTVEGERDDICAAGQTAAAHDLCSGLRPYLKRHHMQAGVGHYGVFSGNRWTNQIYPLVKNVILASE